MNSSIRYITFAYTIGLCLLGVVSTSVWYTTIVSVKAQGKNAALMNVAGRQRMLAQNMIKHFLLLQQYSFPKAQQQQIQYLETQ